MIARICLLTGFTLISSAGLAAADDVTDAAIPNQPKVPGVLRLHLRERQEVKPKSGRFEVVERDVEWHASETAIIICDMWEDHSCKMSAHRVDVMAPDMNRIVSAARSLGVTIIHAPSSGMEYYDDTPQRKRMKAALEVKPPVPIEGWCYLDPEREADYPIPYSHSVIDGCDDPVYAGDMKTSRRQHPAIKIVGYDGVSDSGVEIYNFFEQQGIKNVVLMGVHTHYCVLGRSFGIRQMVRLGKNVVLARDLTDAMYDPRKPPFVSHAHGTELAIEHIEKYWCPSIEGVDLTKVIPGSADAVETATAGNDE
ncbi:MAG: cysteine hydrolase family protein [Planctomycetaceae bacterium]